MERGAGRPLNLSMPHPTAPARSPEGLRTQCPKEDLWAHDPSIHPWRLVPAILESFFQGQSLFSCTTHPSGISPQTPARGGRGQGRGHRPVRCVLATLSSGNRGDSRLEMGLLGPIPVQVECEPPKCCFRPRSRGLVT